MQTQFEFTPERLVAGVDEVGRGPLAGAVVTAAVILDHGKPLERANDVLRRLLGLDKEKTLSRKDTKKRDKPIKKTRRAA